MTAETEIQAIPKLLTDESSKYKGPGWQLRTAREAAQIGIGDIARQLRLSVDMIASIERDDYSRMAGLIFIRGYLRSYARLLNLPEEEILIAFDRLGIPEKIPQIPLNIYGSKQTTLNEGTLRMIGYAVVAGLAILAVLWWHSQSNNTQAALAKTNPTRIQQPATVSAPQPASHPPVNAPLNQTVTPDRGQMLNKQEAVKSPPASPKVPATVKVYPPQVEERVQESAVDEQRDEQRYEQRYTKPKQRSMRNRVTRAEEEESFNQNNRGSLARQYNEDD